MIHYKPEVTEIVIARFTHFPSPEQVAKAWSDAKRALEVDGKEFPRSYMGFRPVDRGYEIFVTMA